MSASSSNAQNGSVTLSDHTEYLSDIGSRYSTNSQRISCSEELLFKELAFFDCEDQAGEGDCQFRLRCEKSLEDGPKRDHRLFERIQTAQLSLVDDDQSSFLSKSSTDSEDEKEDNIEQNSPQVARLLPAIVGPDAKPHKIENRESKTPKTKKTRKNSGLCICLTYCKYESVHRVARKFGFAQVLESENWNLFWTDGCVTLARMMEMKKFQKINHFPGMSEICRKDLLARNMNRMLKSFPKEYNIFPRTWCLPTDFPDFLSYAKRKKARTYIIKPESSCQGRGIWLTRRVAEIPKLDRQICQQYIVKPFLIDGLKFDFRIYVVVTSVDPFRIYVFKDGLARFATSKYVEPTRNNIGNIFMHLTNYAINKMHFCYTVDDEAGSKRRISTVFRWLENSGYDVRRLWGEIDDVIIKTLISAQGNLRQNYKTCFLNHDLTPACFDILGFDILLDCKLKPYLLEVNHSPSFHTDTALDKDIKETLIYDTLRLVNFHAVDRKQCLEDEKRKIVTRLTTIRKGSNPSSDRANFEKSQERFNIEQLQYEDAHLGNFRRIFPVVGSDRYEKFLSTSSTLFQETATFRAHVNFSRLQREKIQQKEKDELKATLKRRTDHVRAESPERRRKRQKPKVSRIPKYCGVSTIFVAKKSHRPGDIVGKEEIERINSLIERDSIMKSMRIPQFVQNMFYHNPEPSLMDLRLLALAGRLKESSLPASLGPSSKQECCETTESVTASVKIEPDSKDNATEEESRLTVVSQSEDAPSTQTSNNTESAATVISENTDVTASSQTITEALPNSVCTSFEDVSFLQDASTTLDISKSIGDYVECFSPSEVGNSSEGFSDSTVCTELGNNRENASKDVSEEDVVSLRAGSSAGDIFKDLLTSVRNLFPFIDMKDSSDASSSILTPSIDVFSTSYSHFHHGPYAILHDHFSDMRTDASTPRSLLTACSYTANEMANSLSLGKSLPSSSCVSAVGTSHTSSGTDIIKPFWELNISPRHPQMNSLAPLCSPQQLGRRSPARTRRRQCIMAGEHQNRRDLKMLLSFYRESPTPDRCSFPSFASSIISQTEHQKQKTDHGLTSSDKKINKPEAKNSANCKMVVLKQMERSLPHPK